MPDWVGPTLSGLGVIIATMVTYFLTRNRDGLTGQDQLIARLQVEINRLDGRMAAFEERDRIKDERIDELEFWGTWTKDDIPRMPPPWKKPEWRKA